MKNCAIVCEYNPFHNGHMYQIDAVRRAGFDNVFCVMSGQFVQSALPAFCDKAIRAECAAQGGADAVIELPTVYATGGAQYFAEGAIKIVGGIKDISALAMGAFCDRDMILSAAEIKNSTEFCALLKKSLADGKSYNAASAAAICALYEKAHPDKDISPVFSDPNSILCIEYISAISKFAPRIEPLIIKRTGKGYNSDELDGEYVSASAIRTAYANGRQDEVRKYIPFRYDVINEYRNTHAPDMSAYKKMAVYSLRTSDIARIAALRDCGEGLEYLLKELSALSYDNIIESASCKRYGKKRIARLLFACMMNITKDLTQKRFVTRLLACKDGFDFSLLPDFVKTNNAALKNSLSDSEIAAVLAVDVDAAALYNVLTDSEGGYYNYSLVKI